MKPDESPAHRQSRVFLVDDHPMVRERLAALIEREIDLTICGEADDAPTAIQKIPAAKPDLVLLDLALKNSLGLELLKDLRVLLPDLPVLVLSMHDELIYAERVLLAGGRGYITKQEATTRILIAIRQVLAGEVYLGPEVGGRILQRLARIGTKGPQTPVEALTDRELEVFRMIGQGLGTRRIAEDLHLGIKTVETYKARIREKLGLSDSTQVLQQAIRWLQDHQA
jgi:DNA-binding NarL/FixJ family response regulator